MKETKGSLGWVLGLAAVLHVGLALWFANVTPYRTGGTLKFQRAALQKDIGAPDERQHANYVQHLLDGKGFPVFNPQAPDLYESYQSHQPPLYYLVAAGWSKVVGISDVTASSSGLRLRALNALLGGACVAGVFFLAFWSTRRLEIGACAAFFAALLPMNLALSGAVSNDPLLFALCTWALALMVRGVQFGWTMKRALTVGLLCGLAMLTKTTAVALIPVLVLALWWGRSVRPGPIWQPALAAFGLMLLLAVPWWLRNQQLYGDPFALGAFNQAFVGSAKPGPLIEALGSVGPDWLPASLKYWIGYNDVGLGVGWWTLRSFFGAFGYMDIFLHGRIYGALGLLVLVGLVAAVWPDRSEGGKQSWLPKALCGVYFLLVFLFFVRFNTQYFQAQARYLLPAIGPISLALALGFVRLTKARPWLPAVLVLMVLLALDIGILSWLPGEFAARELGTAPNL